MCGRSQASAEWHRSTPRDCVSLHEMGGCPPHRPRRQERRASALWVALSKLKVICMGVCTHEYVCTQDQGATLAIIPQAQPAFLFHHF